MKKVIIVICFLFINILLFSQNTVNNLSVNNKSSVFIGIDTGTSNNFTKIRETLANTEGIKVYSYCELNNIIKLSFDKKVFDELVSVFDFIEKRFDNTICYHMKHYTDESYQKMCNEELLKRNLGGNR